MAKGSARTQWVCQQCGSVSFRWVGRCPNCGEWNTLIETVESPPAHPSPRAEGLDPPKPITQIDSNSRPRLPVSVAEFNRVLGGGIVPGSLILLGGDPGIGKSTLLLQIAAAIAKNQGVVLYVSGEESPHQIKMRADRLGLNPEALYLVSENDLEVVENYWAKLHPKLVIIDSIQAVSLGELESTAGGITQLRECTLRLMERAKATDTAVFLIGHVTKEGAIAGPKALEHIVDVVLYLEGERFQTYRLLRGVKNRFGSTNEIGVFEMREEGMVEVGDPSAIFLSQRGEPVAGSVVVTTMEGTRPILAEVQALTTPTYFAIPRRTATGIDFNRLMLITAVLTKRIGLALSNQDIYVNVTGGLQITEPAADLGAALAIISSYRDEPVIPGLVVMGEIGLAGEIRPVGQVEKRLSECARLGFTKCILPKMKRPVNFQGLEILEAGSLRETLQLAFPTSRRLKASQASP